MYLHLEFHFTSSSSISYTSFLSDPKPALALIKCDKVPINGSVTKAIDDRDSDTGSTTSRIDGCRSRAKLLACLLSHVSVAAKKELE